MATMSTSTGSRGRSAGPTMATHLHAAFQTGLRSAASKLVGGRGIGESQLMTLFSHLPIALGAPWGGADGSKTQIFRCAGPAAALN
jgi:hypothetical protein